jgi:hypothetical protein
VGVVDVLPLCLSSVYVFYDPDLSRSWVELGKLTALKEIAWVQQAQRIAPRLRYYYMGFYVHSVQKMRYKGDYSPSDLLCPGALQWVPLDRAKPDLDVSESNPFGMPRVEALRIQTERESVEHARARALVASMPILLCDQGRLFTVEDMSGSSLRSRLQALVEQVGPIVAERLLIVFNLPPDPDDD